MSVMILYSLNVHNYLWGNLGAACKKCAWLKK